MIRIALCCREASVGESLFARTVEILRSVRMPCEMTRYQDPASALAKLNADPGFYRIWILDAADPECCALSGSLRKKSLEPCIIFVDRDLSRRHALLKSRPSALITGDELQGRLKEALESCCAEQTSADRGFMVKNRDGVLRFDYEQILFFESRQRLAILHTVGKTVEFYAKLSQVMEQLPQDMFLHCHQSCIVNLAKVSRLDKANRCFILNTGTAVEISKSGYSQAVAKYDAYTGK